MEQHCDHKEGIISKVPNGTRISYNLPIFFVARSGNKCRLILNLRHLTPTLPRLRMSLRNVLKRIPRLHSHYRLFMINLKNAFYQVCLAHDARLLTAFTGPNRQHYVFNRLPMGMRQSPAVLQCALMEILDLAPNAGIQFWTHVHVDDILVITYANHLYTRFNSW